MKSTNLVGLYLRQRRESLSLSQKALGQLFSPAVTTQFVSNVERGITPLPASHIPTVLRVLKIPENELMAIMEKEYVHKLSHKLGKDHPVTEAMSKYDPQQLRVDAQHWAFFNELYHAYSQADGETRKTFHQVCQTVLKLKAFEQLVAEKKSA